MGYYINQTSTGQPLPSIGKVKALVLDGAKIVAPEYQPNLVCVVDNGPFEAAGYCYSEEEFKEFNNPGDWRPKTWLVHPLAEQLAK
jgi:hypothetical protein